jgi:endonuclease/exonuclease/phosphatase (EEP) superfamily protein YafD
MSQPLQRYWRLSWFPTGRVGWFIAFLTVCVAVPTLARLLAIEVGPLAWVIALTPYVGLAAVVGAFLAIASRSVVVIALALGCVVLQIAWVVPLYTKDADRTISGDALTVMTSNILVGRGDCETVVQLVEDRNVDLLAMQELTPDAVDQLRAAGLNQLLPYRWLDESAAGIGIWSRFPLSDPPAGSAVSWPVIGRQVAVPGLPLTFLAVHPAAPLTPDHTKWTQDQPRLRRALNSVPGAVVVAGDFNATLDHKIMRELQRDGFTDASEATGSGINATWPQGYGFRFPLVAIDHVMHRDVDIAAVGVDTAIVPGADHRAVIATYARAE